MSKKFLVTVKLTNKIRTYPITAKDSEAAHDTANKLLGVEGYVLDCIEMEK